jgi:hypothetical protein
MSTSADAVAKPRLGAGVIVLLVFVSVANVVALAIGIGAWEDEATHGGDLEDLAMQAAVATTLLSIVALVGIGGAWARRRWGPRTYLGAQAAGVLFALVLGAVGLLSFVPLLLAGLLWWLAERDW